MEPKWPERQEYRGHRIELRTREDEPEAMPDLLIDNEQVSYDQLPDRSYAVHEYAYDWHRNLMDLARRFIDYQDRVNDILRESGSGE